VGLPAIALRLSRWQAGHALNKIKARNDDMRNKQKQLSVFSQKFGIEFSIEPV